MSRVFERDVALCFNSTDFEKENFDPDSFVAAQGRVVDLQVLLKDIKTYQSKIKNSLIEVINRDYQNFVDLSKTLLDVDADIEKVYEPLRKWKSDLSSIENEILESLTSSNQVLSDKKDLIRRKEQINSLKSIETVLVALEAALFDSYGERVIIKNLDKLKRLSLELSSVQSKLNLCEASMVSELQTKRLQSIESHLLHLIGNHFESAVYDENPDQLNSVFQLYSALEKLNHAEDQYRQKIVCPYMKEKISRLSNDRNCKAFYDEVLNFFPQKALFVMRTTELSGVPFRFETNSVFAEAVDCISREYPHFFMPDACKDFKSRYDISMSFLSEFESTLSSKEKVDQFRKSQHYRNFCDRWSLPVYFQLVLQELISGLEDAITHSSYSKSGDSSRFQLVVSKATSDCLERLWSTEIFILPLISKFLRLTLQVGFRFLKWSLVVRESFSNRRDNGNLDPIQQTEKVDSRNDIQYRDFVVLLLSDIEGVSSFFLELISSRISEELRKLPMDKDECSSSSSDVFNDISNRMLQIVPEIRNEVIDQLTSDCLSALKPVSEIPRLYRKTNRSVPETPSDYIKAVLSIISEFNKKFKPALSSSSHSGIISTVSRSFSSKYQKNITEICDSVEKIEQSLKKIRSSKSLKSLGDFPVASAPEKGSILSDSEKIYLQLYIDVEFYSCQICEYLPDLAADSSMESLMESVQFASVYREKVIYGR